jgi:hypothetical protein
MNWRHLELRQRIKPNKVDDKTQYCCSLHRPVETTPSRPSSPPSPNKRLQHNNPHVQSTITMHNNTTLPAFKTVKIAKKWLPQQ